ncbi:hypothetical protein ACP70R_015568 [Stipagrostis hirtigluma subsp. patula]
MEGEIQASGSVSPIRPASIFGVLECTPVSHAPKGPISTSQSPGAVREDLPDNTPLACPLGSGLLLSPGSNKVRPPRRVSCPKAVQELIAKGEEQTVQIPLVKIFEEITQVMKGPPALYDYELNENKQFEVTVEFTVPKNYATCNHDLENKVKSLPSPELLAAEENAMKRAFHYLASEHQIVVTDHSSCLLLKYDEKCHKIYSKANNIKTDLIDTAIISLEKAIIHVDELEHQLSMMSFGATEVAKKVHTDSIQNINSMLKKFKEWYNVLEHDVAALEADRLLYLKANNERCTRESIQEPRKKITLSEKFVLCYLTNHIGSSRKPLFLNEPVGKYSFSGEVLMALPRIEHVACGGVTKIPGPVQLTGLLAEEKAAMEAVKFIERHVKIRVADLNFPQRLAAKKRKDDVKNLLKQALNVHANVVKHISYMVEYAAATKDVYDDCGIFDQSKEGDEDVVVFDLCKKILCEVEAAFSKIYDEVRSTGISISR